MATSTSAGLISSGAHVRSGLPTTSRRRTAPRRPRGWLVSPTRHGQCAHGPKNPATTCRTTQLTPSQSTTHQPQGSIGLAAATSRRRRTSGARRDVRHEEDARDACERAGLRRPRHVDSLLASVLGVQQPQAMEAAGELEGPAAGRHLVRRDALPIEVQRCGVVGRHGKSIAAQCRAPGGSPATRRSNGRCLKIRARRWRSPRDTSASIVSSRSTRSAALFPRPVPGVQASARVEAPGDRHQCRS